MIKVFKTQSDSENSSPEKKVSFSTSLNSNSHNTNSNYIIADDDLFSQENLNQARKRSKNSLEVGIDPYASLIEKSERDFQGEKGEISNIE